MQKIELGLIALGSVVISLGVSVLYQTNFDAKEITQKNSTLAPDSALEDLHERLSNLEQRNPTSDSTLNIVALEETLSSLQEQLTELQEQQGISAESSTEEENNEYDYLAEQQREELEIRRKEHWDSQVYNSQQNIQYADEINELFASNNESELINSECGAAACRIEIAFDHTSTEPDFIDKIDQLEWVEWANTTIEDGQVTVYISSNNELMNEPSTEY